jgi:hypothetical protein
MTATETNAHDGVKWRVKNHLISCMANGYFTFITRGSTVILRLRRACPFAAANFFLSRLSRTIRASSSRLTCGRISLKRGSPGGLKNGRLRSMPAAVARARSRWIMSVILIVKKPTRSPSLSPSLRDRDRDTAPALLAAASRTQAPHARRAAADRTRRRLVPRP